MVSSRMAVSDPCYDADVWCRGELENVLPGTWQAYAIKRDKGEWGPRVVRLVAVHREYADTCETVAELASFEVGVDSGQAGLFDCLHYRDDTVAVEHPNVSWKGCHGRHEDDTNEKRSLCTQNGIERITCLCMPRMGLTTWADAPAGMMLSAIGILRQKKMPSGT